MFSIAFIVQAYRPACIQTCQRRIDECLLAYAHAGECLFTKIPTPDMVGYILVSAIRVSYHLIVSGLVRTFPLEEGLPSLALHSAYWSGHKKPVSYTPTYCHQSCHQCKDRWGAKPPQVRHSQQRKDKYMPSRELNQN